MRRGGAETACLSTSQNLREVRKFARKNNSKLLFRLAIESPMEYGAEIKWLSTVPDEDEVKGRHGQ